MQEILYFFFVLVNLGFKPWQIKPRFARGGAFAVRTGDVSPCASTSLRRPSPSAGTSGARWRCRHRLRHPLWVCTRSGWATGVRDLRNGPWQALARRIGARGVPCCGEEGEKGNRLENEF